MYSCYQKDKDEVEYDESGSLLHDVKKMSVWRKIFYAVGGMWVFYSGDIAFEKRAFPP